ncbi:hypothetical protein ACFL0D_09580, partial [Thermoproteota archaeon]
MVDLPWFTISGGILVTIIVIGVFAIWKIQKELRSGFDDRLPCNNAVFIHISLSSSNRDNHTKRSCDRP